MNAPSSPPDPRLSALVVLAGIVSAWALLVSSLADPATPKSGSFWGASLVVALLAISGIRRLAAIDGPRIYASASALLFGAWLLYFWQLLTVAMDVPRVLLPAPSLIAAAFGEHMGTLQSDFVQTVVRAVALGWVLGSGLGFCVGIAIDRMPFLQRGLLPLASLTSTIPLVGVAPIAVMWFGFEWPSKAAVVVLMTFFPMLVSTLAGLRAADRLERELMYSYAASYWRTLWSLRLPTALPFLISALKVNATLALIGAIVAEFFGSPTSGLGFRISTEATRMNMGLVWAAVAVAAITGSAVYALLVAIEKRAAFWHPSVRGKK